MWYMFKKPGENTRVLFVAYFGGKKMNECVFIIIALYLVISLLNYLYYKCYFSITVIYYSFSFVFSTLIVALVIFVIFMSIIFIIICISILVVTVIHQVKLKEKYFCN